MGTAVEDIPETERRVLQHQRHFASLKRVLQSLRNVAEQTKGPIDPEDAAAHASSYRNLVLVLKASHRAAQLLSIQTRAKVAAESVRLDDNNLLLQNVLYEKHYLQQQITECRAFPCIYQNVQLEPIDRFEAEADEDLRDSALLGQDLSASTINEETVAEVKVPPASNEETEHNLMLARLQWEKRKRRTLEEQRQLLASKKGAMMKANRQKKLELESLDSRLESFVSQAWKLRSSMGGDDVKRTESSVPHP